MDFKTATDQVAGCITHVEIAEAAGVSIQSIRQARMDPGSPSYRNPPAGWQEVLASLARQRSRELAAFADQIDRA
ncbi:MAG TPA: hypothetical protein VF006_06540 [Longimicrobium sp.]